MSISLYLTFLSLSLLSIGMEKHYKNIVNNIVNKNIKNISMFLGYIFLFVSLIVFINTLGISLGLTYWIGILGIFIVFIALILTYKPKSLPIVILVFLPISLINYFI